MSYVGMQYTNPGWTNNTHPPVNASNLNDISNALQSVNVTQQERTTLGASTTDTLGKMLMLLKSGTDNVRTLVASIQQQLGTNRYEIGSYIGNGSSTLQIATPFEVKFFVAVSEEPQSQHGSMDTYAMIALTKTSVTIADNSMTINSFTVSPQNITVSTIYGDYANIVLNMSGLKVNYIIFG